MRPISSWARSAGLVAAVVLGLLALAPASVSAQTASTSTASKVAPSGNLTLKPGGDLILDPTGNDVLPETNFDVNLGMLTKKYLSLHAAELWVETLVAQNTIATIGGRILVGPTTELVSDLTSTFAYPRVKHNEWTPGDVVYAEANGSVEFMRVTVGPVAEGDHFYYAVTRDYEGSGSGHAWPAGTALFNTGQAGDGFIDLYSVAGVKAGTEIGPSIVGNVRTGTAYNAWAPRWAIGNLNGVYGYSANTYGAAFGDNSASWVKVDSTNGVRLGNGATTSVQITPAGTASIAGTVTIGGVVGSSIAGWAHGSDTTKIDGGDIYTSTITADKIAVGGGRNLLSNTEFRVSLIEPADPSHAWRDGGGDDGLTWSVGRNLSSWYPAGGGAAFLSGTGSMPYTKYHAAYGPWVPVVPGARYEYSAYLGLHRVDVAHLAMAWYTTAGAYISAGYGSPEVTATSATAGGTRLDGYGRAYGFWTAPATAAYAMPYIVAICTTVAGCDADPYLFWTRPYLGEAGSGQITPTPWGPGGSTIITADTIKTGTVTADKLAADLVVANTIRSSGATALDTGTGFWLDTTSTPTFRVGNPSGNYMRWNGSAVKVKGEVEATSGSFSGAVTATSGSFAAGSYSIDNTGFRYSSSSGMTGGSSGLSLFAASGKAMFFSADAFTFSNGWVQTGSGYGFSGQLGSSGTRSDAYVDDLVANTVSAGNGGDAACTAGVDAIYVTDGIVTSVDCTGAGGASQASLRDELESLRAEVATLRAVVAELRRASPGLKYAAVRQDE